MLRHHTFHCPNQTRHPFHPSQKLPTLVNAIWSTGNSWQETSCYFLDVHRPPSPQHPRAHQHRSTSVKHGPLITHIRDHLLKWILGNLHPPNFPSVSLSTGHNHRHNITCECPAGTGPHNLGRNYTLNRFYFFSLLLRERGFHILIFIIYFEIFLRIKRTDS